MYYTGSMFYGLIPLVIAAFFASRSKHRWIRWVGSAMYWSMAVLLVVLAGYQAGQGQWRLVGFMALGFVLSVVFEGGSWLYREWWYWRIQRDLDRR